VLTAGNFTVDLFALSDSGCSDSYSIPVQIPPLPQASFSWSVDPCDSTVRFTNTSLNGSDYQWNFGDSTIIDSYSPTHTYQLAGSIPVQLITIGSYGCSDTLTDSIFFVSYKAAVFESFQDSCAGELSFSGVTENAVAYFWDFGDGTTSTDRFPVHSYTSDGTYEVALTVNGEYSCVDSLRKQIDFERPKGERVFLPAAFTPNDDGLNDQFSASIYKPCEYYSIRIYNRWGAEIYSAADLATAVWDGTYNGERVPGGIYTYILIGESRTRYGTICVIY
jgi:gliding motility-associated-like protein